MGVYLKQVTGLDADGRVVTNLGPPVLSTDSATKGYVDDETAIYSLANKSLSPSTTSGDESTTDLYLVGTPTRNSFVNVLVNGSAVEVGDGVKSKDCYFSGDVGVTARSIINIAAGDVLYWNGVISGFNLAASDVVDINYVVSGTSSQSTERRLVLFDSRVSVSGVVTGSAPEVFTTIPAANAGKIVSAAGIVPVGTTAIVLHTQTQISSARHIQIRFRRPGETGHSALVSTSTKVPSGTSLREANGDMLIAPLDGNLNFEQYIFDFSLSTAITGLTHAVYVMGYWA